MLALTLAWFGLSMATFLCADLGIALPHHDTLTYLFVTRGAARLIPLSLTARIHAGPSPAPAANQPVAGAE